MKNHKKLNESDEGELRLAIYKKGDSIVIDFGKEVSWIGFHKKDVEALIETLQGKLQEL